MAKQKHIACTENLCKSSLAQLHSLSLHARHIDKFYWSSIYQFHVFLYFKSFGVIDIYIGRDISLGLHIVLLIGWNRIWKMTMWWECWDMMRQREFVLRMIVMIGFWYKLTSLNAGTDPRFQVRGIGDKPKKKKNFKYASIYY